MMIFTHTCRYKVVNKIIIENAGTARVLLAGFGSNLRQIQAIEKALQAPIGCIYFDALIEKRAERLARHAPPGQIGQEKVRTLCKYISMMFLIRICNIFRN